MRHIGCVSTIYEAIWEIPAKVLPVMQLAWVAVLGVTAMVLPSRKAHLILFLGALILVGLNRANGSQANGDVSVESLTTEQLVAGLTANLNRIRTYKATFVVSDPNGKNAREHTVGWERVSGSDDPGVYDRRFFTVSPKKDPEASDSEPSCSTYYAFNGEKTFICETCTWGERKSIDGTILPALDRQMVGRGLTVTTLSTHFMDIAPIQRVVANGTFVKEGVETVNGHQRVTLYGEYGYAETPFDNWRVKRGPGMYVRLSVDPFSGFMPVKQEWYAVTEVEGKLVRKLIWTHTAQFKEFEGGLWFPIAGSYERQQGRRVLQVKECSLNIDIPQEEFAITAWPPGTFVEDKVANISFRVPRSAPDGWR